MSTALFALAGYLAGSMPFGYWLIKVAKGVDIRTVGSGNIGASNVWRTYGKWYGITAALLDMLKAFAPAFAATLVVGHLAGVIAGASAMLGHWRPIFLGFQRGGKMVATCAGAFLGVAPLVALAGAAVWIVSFLLFRYASVASMLAACSLPVIAAAMNEPWPVIGFAIAAAPAVVFLHRGNIARLRAGTESRFALRRGKAAAQT